MFKKLRNKIVIITMATTTAVLILAGCSIMFFSSTMRPEPKPYPELVVFDTSEFESFGPKDNYNGQELKNYIENDRKEGNTRLLATLLSVGIGIELIVFLISYYLSGKMVAPVKDSYDKQKLFIANASHELKTPLAVIQANMEALEVDKENEKWKDNIDSEINHANKLVLNLLQLARMDADNTNKNQAEEIDLASELKTRIEIFQPKFAGKITYKAGAKTTNYCLPKQDILQILDILFDNATKYGNKKIAVQLEQNSIMITNDGATIPKKDLTKIFDRFYQTDKTREGSGLGLAIAKAICEQNGWEITCESENHLTKFKVMFTNSR